MSQKLDEQTVFWRLHADKLMWMRDNGVHTAILGFQMVASWFNHTPPNSLDIEYSTQLIQNGLMSLKQESFAVEHWLTDDKMLEQLSLRINGTTTVQQQELEDYFQSICQKLNQASSFEQTQLTKYDVAYLLVLREAMLHLDMKQIQFLG